MSFRSLESNANAAVLRHLANATVSIGGVDVPGIFANPAGRADLGVGVSTTEPSVQVASDVVMAAPVGQEVAIDGTPYEIVAADPDGTGLTKLTLGRIQ